MESNVGSSALSLQTVNEIDNHQEYPTPWARPPASWAPWQASGAHLLLYEVFRLRKNKKEAFGTKHRRQEVEPGETNLGLRRSCSAGETSIREGEIITIVITNDPLIGRGSISINIFTSTISSKTLVHLLYTIFVSKPHIGTCGLLVVFITSRSWCLLVYLVEDYMFRSFMHINTPLIMNMNMLCE